MTNRAAYAFCGTVFICTAAVLKATTGSSRDLMLLVVLGVVMLLSAVSIPPQTAVQQGASPWQQ